MTEPGWRLTAPATFEARFHLGMDWLGETNFATRLLSHDHTLWSDDAATPELLDRLGWLGAPAAARRFVPELRRWAQHAAADFDHVVLCGMGGSSLASSVIVQCAGDSGGTTDFRLLDSTHPATVTEALADVDPARAIIVVSSKSGATIETMCFLDYLWDALGGNAAQFVAVSDPGTPLTLLARERNFARIIEADPEVGGRFSALTHFGLAPAALAGVDLAPMVESANDQLDACGRSDSLSTGLAAFLVAAIGENRDKLTLILPVAYESFGLWAEQLVAESTGKLGKGMLPIVREPSLNANEYGPDRCFVVWAEGQESVDVAGLVAAGHPVLTMDATPAELGALFVAWEFAVAAVASRLNVNPFDQPNVGESKTNTMRMLERGSAMLHDGPSGVELLTGLAPPGYVALLSFVPPTLPYDASIRDLRQGLSARLGVATTHGYGPRYLHSTGQYHKGGPATGRFAFIVPPPEDDLVIPTRSYGFGDLLGAQLLGDMLALMGRGLPVTSFASVEEAAAGLIA